MQGFILVAFAGAVFFLPQASRRMTPAVESRCMAALGGASLVFLLSAAVHYAFI